MKRMHLVVVIALTMITLIFAYGQSPQSTSQSRKSVEVTTQTLTRQRPGKPYILDLSHKGKTYSVSADVASRVRIRTAKGEMAMTELMSKLGVTTGRFLAGSKFLIGTQSDLRAINFGRPPTTRRPATATPIINCSPDFCYCDPDIPGDCDGSKLLCDDGKMFCYVCDGPDCSPEQRGRWRCLCLRAPALS